MNLSANAATNNNNNNFLTMKTHTITNSFSTVQLPNNNNNNNPESKILTESCFNNNQIVPTPNGNDKIIEQVWTKNTFNTTKKGNEASEYNNSAISWAEKAQSPNGDGDADADIEDSDDVMNVNNNKDEERVVEDDNQDNDLEEASSPAHHARRPMNAFLIFCKKHRPIVREKHASLENRGVTRILGEWWSQLDDDEKKPYTDLAKEHKDNFLSENPDFKWYKLPAPPLRTLQTRPTPAPKIPTPLSSPTHIHNEPEFNPGKLADESQLGSLTSLLLNNYAGQKSNHIDTENNNKPATEAIIKEHQLENNNNNNNLGAPNTITTESNDGSLTSPVNLIKTLLPPKPIKKRLYEEEKPPDNKTSSVSRNILMEEEPPHDSSMTKQDLFDKVIDTVFTKTPENGLKEVRKSGRSCKGKRYEQFMTEGKLLGNKRDAKLTQQKYFELMGTARFETELNHKLETTPKLGLESTIKRLGERINVKVELDSNNQSQKSDAEGKSNGRLRTISETSDDSFTMKTQNCSNNSNFNLHERIRVLPSLSYDVFVQRKRESKKRKNRPREGDGAAKQKVAKLADKMQPVGSKKRKNKKSITHLDTTNVSDNKTNFTTDLSGLATLAEIAANTEKLNQQNISE